MALMVTTGRGTDIVSAAVRALFDRSSEDISSLQIWKSLGLHEYEPDVPAEQLSDMSAPGTATLTVEGQTFGSNERYNGFPVTLALTKYTSELSYTEEMVHWMMKQNSSKRLSQLNNLVGGALNPLVHQQNLEASKLFYLGHGTTFKTVGNSEALFASHTLRKSSTTQRNTFASGDTHRAFSAGALSDAIDIMNRFRGHNEIQLLPVRSLKLIVPVELEADAIRVVKSEYGPETPNLGLSKAGPTVVQSRGLSIEIVPDPNVPSGRKTQWVLVDNARAVDRALMAVAWNPRLATDEEVRNGTHVVEASSLFGPVSLGWQYAFGSLGTGAAI